MAKSENDPKQSYDNLINAINKKDSAIIEKSLSGDLLKEFLLEAVFQICKSNNLELLQTVKKQCQKNPQITKNAISQNNFYYFQKSLELKDEKIPLFLTELFFEFPSKVSDKSFHFLDSVKKKLEEYPNDVIINKNCAFVVGFLKKEENYNKHDDNFKKEVDKFANELSKKPKNSPTEAKASQLEQQQRRL
jgi:hypothetical protein